MLGGICSEAQIYLCGHGQGEGREFESRLPLPIQSPLRRAVTGVNLHRCRRAVIERLICRTPHFFRSTSRKRMFACKHPQLS